MARPSAHEKVEIAERRRQVAARYLQGLTQSEIAAEFGITQSTVSFDLAACRKQWLETAAADVGQRVAEEMAKVDLLERTYWNAWLRSSSVVGKVQRDGDPRFLSGVQDCLSQRLKILGIGELDRKFKLLEQMLDDAMKKRAK